MNIFNKIEYYFQHQLPFVAYRKPNENTLSGFFVNDKSLYYSEQFSESGFVFAPFNVNEKSIGIYNAVSIFEEGEWES